MHTHIYIYLYTQIYICVYVLTYVHICLKIVIKLCKLISGSVSPCYVKREKRQSWKEAVESKSVLPLKYYYSYIPSAVGKAFSFA